MYHVLLPVLYSIVVHLHRNGELGLHDSLWFPPPQYREICLRCNWTDPWASIIAIRLHL